ncbi:hypothetical protein Tco_0261642 [Tanacetum coccineum]
MMIIVPEQRMNVEALQTKYPIIDWEIYTEGARKGVLTQMLVAKLLVEQDNEMSRELLRKIFMQVGDDSATVKCVTNNMGGRRPELATSQQQFSDRLCVTISYRRKELSALCVSYDILKLWLAFKITCSCLNGVDEDLSKSSKVTDDTNGSISGRTDHSYNTSGVTACMSEYTACVNEVTTTMTRVTSLTEPTPDFMTEVTTTTSGVAASVTEHTAKPIGSTVGVVPSSPNKNGSEKVGKEHAMNDIPSSYATKLSPTMIKMSIVDLKPKGNASFENFMTLAY